MLLPLLLATTATALQYPLGLAAAADLLAVRYPCTRKTVRAAYRRQAAKSHPDKSEAPNAATHFLRITAAYETLLLFATTEIDVSAEETSARAATSAACSSPATSAPPGPTSAVHEDGCFEQRVSRWRDFWKASLQATQLSEEAECRGRHVSVLQGEQILLRARLAALAQRPGGASPSVVDAMRARYVHASAQLADAQCALATLSARVRLLREEAERLQRDAQAAPCTTGFGI